MKRSRTGSRAGKAPAVSPVTTVQVPVPLLAVLADAKTAFFGLCLTAGQQVFRFTPRALLFVRRTLTLGSNASAELAEAP
jgi:hypothetical protein